jgi:hypothetical protein
VKYVYFVGLAICAVAAVTLAVVGSVIVRPALKVLSAATEGVYAATAWLEQKREVRQ